LAKHGTGYGIIINGENLQGGGGYASAGSGRGKGGQLASVNWKAVPPELSSDNPGKVAQTSSLLGYLGADWKSALLLAAQPSSARSASGVSTGAWQVKRSHT
jgi:hypothetical protein